MTFASIIDGNYDSPNTPKGPVKVTISIQQETGKMISEAGGAPYAEIRSLVPPSYSGGIDLEVDGDNLEQNFDLNHFLSDAVNEQARKVLMNIYACPSDLGLQRNQWASPQWARVRGNYTVNAGNTCYGQYGIGAFDFLGAPFKPRIDTRLGEITDGTSHVLLMSEVKVLPETDDLSWNGPMSDFQTALGGQTFTGWNPPNTGQDLVARLLPEQQQLAENGLPEPCRVPCGLQYNLPSENAAAYEFRGETKQQAMVARSHHPGGVNASRCDGSVAFASDDTDEFLWRALTSAAGGETAGP